MKETIYENVVMYYAKKTGIDPRGISLKWSRTDVFDVFVKK